MVACDDLLRSSLGVVSFQFSQLEQLLAPHLLDPEPVVVELTLPAAGASPAAPRVVDVPVDVPVNAPRADFASDGSTVHRDLELLLAARATEAWADSRRAAT